MVGLENLSEDVDNRGSVAVSKETTEMENVFNDEFLNESSEKRRNDDGKTVTFLHLLMTTGSILLYFFDVGTDLYLVYEFYDQRMIFECSYTTLCVIIPTIINFFVSFTVYDEREKASRRCFFLNLPCALLKRTFEALYLSIQFKYYRKDVKYSEIDDEFSDLGLLRIIECYLESAMQLILQMSILISVNNLRNPSLLFPQWLSILTSFLSIAYTTVSYNRASRSAREDQKDLSFCSSTVLFFGLLLLTTSRILALSMIFSLNVICFIVCFIMNGFISTLYIFCSEPPWFCRSPEDSNYVKLTLEVLFGIVLGFIYNFTFIATGDKPKRKKYYIYYGVFILENILAVFLWYRWKQNELIDYLWFVPLIIFTIASSVVGISILILYYLYYHPTKISSQITGLDAEIEKFQNCIKVYKHVCNRRSTSDINAST